MLSIGLFSILNTSKLLALSVSLGIAAAGLTGAAWLIPAASPAPGNHSNCSGLEARERELIQTLQLRPLAKESGLLGIVGVSRQKTAGAGASLAVQSQNYYMLTDQMPLNYLHWLASDDTQILIEGGPVDYYIFHPDGHSELVTLGTDVAHGQRPVVAVPGGCWKALRLHEGVKYALMANALSPEFTTDRVKIGAGAQWVRRYANSSPWATPDNLRQMIGPNWVQ